MSEWISVKDRLPIGKINPITQDFELVICATTFGDVRAYGYGKAKGHDKAHFWFGVGIMDKYVTHWMPLPEPPKESDAEWIDNKGSACGKGIENLIDSREWYENEKLNYCPFCYCPFCGTRSIMEG